MPDDSGTKVYVGGLPFSIDDDGLRDHFASNGYDEIEDAIVMKDREDNTRSRGFGFITFATSEMASAAVKNMDGSDCQGRNLRVDIANNSGRRGGGRGGGGGFRGRSDYGGGRSYQSGSGESYGSKSYGSPYGGGSRGGGGGRYSDRDSSSSYGRSSSGGGGGGYGGGSRGYESRSSGGGGYGGGSDSYGSY